MEHGRPLMGNSRDGLARGPDPRRPADEDGGIGVDPHGAGRSLQRYSHEAMATVFEVVADHPDERYAAQAAHAAFDLADRLERELSRFLPNSDISRINRLAEGERTRVSPSTLECLLVARHAFDLTGGVFNVSIGTGLPSLEIDPEHGFVGATGHGVSVDLGGIGKGYAVGLMAGLLEEWGLSRVLVHGGFSSMLALEPPSGADGWPLTLSDPLEPSRTLVRLAARQTAIGASGLRKGRHIVDPRTGTPAGGRSAAWVTVPMPDIASSEAADGPEPGAAAGAVSDALTTAFMLMRAADIEALCAGNPGLEAWILDGFQETDSGDGRLRHFGHPRTGYTAASS